MATPLVRSSLRRSCAPTGALALLCLVFAATSLAATPAPDPPPVAVAPERPPVAKTVPAPVQRAPVTSRVVRPPAPVVRVRPTAAPTAKPTVRVAKAKVARKAVPKPVHRSKPASAVAAARPPHDRARVPLVSFVAPEAGFDRGLLALGGVGLLLVALGSAVMLVIARRQLLLAGIALALLVPVGEAVAAPVSYTLSGSAGSNGWFTSNVTIRWIVDPTDLVSAACPAAELIAAEGPTNRQCTATFTWGTVTSPVVAIKIDKTPPTGLTAALARGPDANGWFNHPVAASFSGQDAVSGIAGCSSPTYAGGDSASAAVTGTCTDGAGNTASATVSLKYDATPPSVTPAVDRPPDAKGWYRKPLSISFAGSDATSGIAACTAPARFAGPDGPQASVTGSCRDGAGNVAEAKQSFQYDATAPKLEKVKAQVAKGVARVDWARAADVAQVQLVRAPGVNGAKSTIVYQGNGAAFFDRTVKPGIRYRYEISVADVAGNVTSKAVTTASGQVSTLLNPAAGTVVKKPPVLRWRAVKGAAFYNVQLYRNGVKVLSTWPKGAKLQLGRTWRYGGKRQRLSAGTYRWYVWGARGTRARPSYGKALGMSTFVVKR
jgi:hypothetical protein